MKPQRRPQHLEIYSRQYYIDRVRDKVKAEIKDKGLTQKQVLSTIKRLTAEAFEAESTELKEAIYAEAAAGKLARSDDSRTEEVNTPESYAMYVYINLCITTCKLTCEYLQCQYSFTKRIRRFLPRTGSQNRVDIHCPGRRPRTNKRRQDQNARVCIHQNH
jgi:hypothetical protein